MVYAAATEVGREEDVTRKILCAPVIAPDVASVSMENAAAKKAGKA
jgi:hypothetical protein